MNIVRIAAGGLLVTMGTVFIVGGLLNLKLAKSSLVKAFDDAVRDIEEDIQTAPAGAEDGKAAT